jgi:hypothetical protein
MRVALHEVCGSVLATWLIVGSPNKNNQSATLTGMIMDAASVILFVLLMLATPVLSPACAIVFGGAGFGLSAQFWLGVWLLYVAPD